MTWRLIDFFVSIAMLTGLCVFGGWPAAFVGALWCCLAYWEGLAKGRQQVQAQFDSLAEATRNLLDAMPSEQAKGGETDFVAMVHRFRAARINAAIAASKKGGAA